MNKTLKNFLYSVPFAVASMLPFSCEKPEPPKPTDNVAPVINVISPVDKMTYESNNVPLSWSIAEENYKKGYFKINGGKEYEIGKTGSKDTLLGNGTYNILFFAEDNSSNKSSKNLEIIVNKPSPDTTPPKINFSTPENNKTYVVGEIPFSWNITDASGVASSSYSLNGVSKSINSSGSETLNLSNGNYELKVRATDNKNNSKDTTVNFVVNIPPTYKYTINPFVQPNDSTLNWYGSGDVDGNNKVEQNDLNKLEQILNGTFTPNLESNNPIEYRTLDRADLNGDEKVDAVDKQILQEKLNGTREYLPGEWNKLKTRAEREEWLLKMIAIDKTNELTYIPDEFDCSEFADQFMINFHGSDEIGYDKNKGLKDNGRFNIPIYRTSVTSTNFGHGMNMTVTGNNFQTFSDHYHIEPQIDLGRNSNNWLLTNFPDGCEVRIRGPPRDGELTSEGMATIRIFDGNIFESKINTNPEVRIIKTREESNGLK